MKNRSTDLKNKNTLIVPYVIGRVKISQKLV